MLMLEDVRVAQGDFFLSVTGQIDPGFVSIIGPSGSGKSTLLSAIAGFAPSVSGRIIWKEQDITNLSPRDRPVSVVFQDNNLFPHLTVAQNVALGVQPRLNPSRATMEKVNLVLGKVGLSEMGSRKPGALSGGQQSRAALARVLLADKPIVLLDEPFAALGPGLRQEMLALTSEVLDGKLVLMVTHDPKDAQQISDRTILVSDGIVMPAVPTAELFTNPPIALQDYLGNAQ